MMLLRRFMTWLALFTAPSMYPPDTGAVSVPAMMRRPPNTGFW